MKVLHVINGLPVGGAEIFLLRLLENLQQSPIENVVCTLRPDTELLPKFQQIGVSVEVLGGKATDLFRLRRFVNQTQPDVIHSWLYHSILATELTRLSLMSRFPVCWGIHHTIQRLELEKSTTRFVIKTLRHFSSRAERVIYVSQAGREQHERIGFDTSKSLVIPNGYNVEKFSPDSEAGQRFRQSIGASKGDFLIGILARYNPVKDHACFIEAAAYCAKEMPQAKFVLVGRDITESNEAIMTLINSHGISNCCFVLGERSDVSDIINGLDAVVSSSLSEAFPIVIGEAMSCGTPVVVTDVGDSALLVGDERWVVPSADPQGLAQSILRLAEFSPSQRQQLGLKLRQRVIDNFSIAAISQQYFDIYASVDKVN